MMRHGRAPRPEGLLRHQLVPVHNPVRASRAGLTIVLSNLLKYLLSAVQSNEFLSLVPRCEIRVTAQADLSLVVVQLSSGRSLVHSSRLLGR